jgi:predicted HTH transcriptional regulator
MRWDYKTNSPNPALTLAVAKVLSSYMNASGGTLLIGVNNNREVLGLEKDFSTLSPGKQNSDGFELQFTQAVKNYLGVEATKHISLKFETLDGKIVARATVSPSSSPVYVKSGDKTEFYARIGNASLPLSMDEMVRYMKSKSN